MTAYFFDSSARVKRYVREDGSDWVLSCFTDPPANTVFIAEVTLVEVGAAIARRMRSGSLPLTYWQQFRSLFFEAHLREYEIVPFERSFVEQAILLSFKKRLRAYDAIQLATAILVQGRLQIQALPLLTFVSSDKDLLEAASTPEFELHLVDPAAYP